MKEGDRIQLNRMLQFRNAMEQAIIEKNGYEMQRISSLPTTEVEAIAMAKVMPTIDGQQKHILNRAEQLLKGHSVSMPASTKAIGQQGAEPDDIYNSL
jgi:hypothetical protein